MTSLASNWRKYVPVIVLVAFLAIIWAHDITRGLGFVITPPGLLPAGSGTETSGTFQCEVDACVVQAKLNCDSATTNQLVKFRSTTSTYNNTGSWIAVDNGAGLKPYYWQSKSGLMGYCLGQAISLNTPQGYSINAGSNIMYICMPSGTAGKYTYATYVLSTSQSGPSGLLNPLESNPSMEVKGGITTTYVCSKDFQYGGGTETLSYGPLGSKGSVDGQQHTITAGSIASFDGVINYWLFTKDEVQVTINSEQTLCNSGDMFFTFSVENQGKTLSRADIQSATVSLKVDGETVSTKPIGWDFEAGVHKVTFSTTKTGSVEITVAVQTKKGASGSGSNTFGINIINTAIGIQTPDWPSDDKFTDNTITYSYTIQTVDQSGKVLPVDSVEVKIKPPLGTQSEYQAEVTKLDAGKYFFVFTPEETGQQYYFTVTARKSGIDPVTANLQLTYEKSVVPGLSLDPIAIVGLVAGGIIVFLKFGKPLFRRLGR